MSRYQDIYPSDPLLDSAKLDRLAASDLLTFEYFEAEPSTMPTQTFDQHHVLINLNDIEHRVENWRNGDHHDFTFKKNEIVITPAGVESGWKWHTKSKVIVITLEPIKLEKFAINEVGIILSKQQLENVPLKLDEEITAAACLVLEALERKEIGYDVIFEALSRVFLVKLLQKFAHKASPQTEFNKGFSPTQFKKVLDYISQNFGSTINLEDLSKVAGISRYHFSRLFKETIGASPMQFLLEYRLEEAKKLLPDKNLTLSDIAARCGFADQAHFPKLQKILR